MILAIIKLIIKLNYLVSVLLPPWGKTEDPSWPVADDIYTARDESSPFRGPFHRYGIGFTIQVLSSGN